MDPEPKCSDPYLTPVVLRHLDIHDGPRRILDVGCGNGRLCGLLLERGHRVVGVDQSSSGIRFARATYPSGRFEHLDAADLSLDVLDEEPFDVVVSTEVIEHVFDPREFVARCGAVLSPGGQILITTPYHGWLKNVLIAASGRFDEHVNPLFLGGHIKHFSHATLTRLLEEEGFDHLQFAGAGRLPFLWKSMVMWGRRRYRRRSTGSPSRAA